MKAFKKFRFIALVLAVVTLLASCTANAADKEEILSEFSALYEKSLTINEYIFGKGLPVDGEYDPETLVSPYYVEVSESSPYKTKDELEAAILSVYSYQYYSSSLKQTLFDGFGENSKVKPLYSFDKEGKLSIDVTHTSFPLDGRFDTATATVKSARTTSAEVKASYKNGSAESEYTLKMVRNAEGWRLDEPTY